MLFQKNINIIISFFLLIICPAYSHATPADPKIILAIAKDFDGLLGDTVDEGSWNADIRRSPDGQPKDAHCTVSGRKPVQSYTCEFRFDLRAYQPEELGTERWGSGCDGLRYRVHFTNRPTDFRIERDSGISECIDKLSESP